MAEIKIKADSNGGTVSLKGPATTTGNAAVQLTLPVDDGTANQYLQTNGSGVLSWATVSSTPEGTAIKSTGETGTSKFLRIDGDNTCSWQTVPAATTTSGTDNFTVADGNLVIGTAGHGIDFSATSDLAGKSSELLDDYEEGTFTPTIVGDGRTRTYNGSYTGGTYTKVGNVCTVHAAIYVSSQSGSFDNSYAEFVLPFSRAGVTSAMWWSHHPCFLQYVADAEIAKIVCVSLMSDISTAGRFTYLHSQQYSTAGMVDMDWHSPGNNYQIGVSFTYITA